MTRANGPPLLFSVIAMTISVRTFFITSTDVIESRAKYIIPPTYSTKEQIEQRRKLLSDLFYKYDFMGWNSFAIVEVCGYPLSTKLESNGDLIYHYSLNQNDGYVRFRSEDFGLVVGCGKFWTEVLDLELK